MTVARKHSDVAARRVINVGRGGVVGIEEPGALRDDSKIVAVEMDGVCTADQAAGAVAGVNNDVDPAFWVVVVV